MTHPKTILPVLFLLTLSVSVSAAENWPAFLGPNGDNHSPAVNLPETWSESENIVWKTAIRDFGWSSPVIWGNQMWMTAAPMDGLKMYAVCVDKNSGEIVHDILVFENPTTEDDELLINSFASCTPCVEEGRVYVHFGRYGTACLDTKTGEKIWERRDYQTTHFRGPGSSPILYKDMLVVHYDGGDSQYVVAFNKKTGKTAWKTDRSVNFGTLDDDLRKAYETPTIVKVDGKDQLITNGAEAGYGYDPQTGEEIWRVCYRGFSNTSRPVLAEEHILFNTGFGKANMLAVRLGGKGDVTDTHVAWELGRTVPLKPTVVFVDGHIYMMDDHGIFSCVDPADGEILWQTRFGGAFSSTPLYADGKLYCFDEGGKCYVLRLSPDEDKKEVVAVNTLDDGLYATPCAQDGTLFVRTKTYLYRIGK